MTAHVHHFHLYLFIMLIVTASLCVLAVIIKMKNKKGPKLLKREKYNSTLTEKMVEVKEKTVNFSLTLNLFKQDSHRYTHF